MKKLFLLLFVVATASSLLAQENVANTTMNAIITGRVVRDEDNGKTINLKLGEKLFVHLSDESSFIYGDEQYGVKAVPTIFFTGLSNPDVLVPFDGEDLDCPKRFVVHSVGQATLSYNKITRYVSYGGCSVPMSILTQSISFNVVVTE